MLLPIKLSQARHNLGPILLGFLVALVTFSAVHLSSSSSTSRTLSNFYRFNAHARGANPYNYQTTLNRLNSHFPYDDSARRIDKTIFQMWKVGLDDPDFPNRDYVLKWKNENPNYTYNLYTDDEIHHILETHFSNSVPEVLEAFDMMPNKIIQSDFSRYLLIFLFGGVYADIDTYLEKPVDSWFDADRNVGFVVAVEEDINDENWEHYMTRRIQFEQWSFKAKARHPILKKLIAKIVETTFNAEKNNKLAAYYKDFTEVDKCNSVDIMEWTGPVVWTDTIYSHLNSIHSPKIVDIDSTRAYSEPIYGPEILEGQTINWKVFAGLQAPVMIDDVVIYPKISFREDPENNCGKWCYIHHHFGGSWKNDGKGEIKPDESQNNIKKHKRNFEEVAKLLDAGKAKEDKTECNAPYKQKSN
ncbi:hypothetical protein DAMA08_041980 [Martiniozyma asiatica (nom. inval.)]|nr:hypothetical protein DAMA08_041980 [Martiniozyma asiatica]